MSGKRKSIKYSNTKLIINLCLLNLNLRMLAVIITETKKNTTETTVTSVVLEIGDGMSTATLYRFMAPISPNHAKNSSLGAGWQSNVHAP